MRHVYLFYGSNFNGGVVEKNKLLLQQVASLDTEYAAS